MNLNGNKPAGLSRNSGAIALACSLLLSCESKDGTVPLHPNEEAQLSFGARHDGLGDCSMSNIDLITNGDAEAGSGSPNGSLVAVPGWAVTGEFTAVQYGAVGGFPTSVTPGPVDGGLNFLAGGPSSGVSVGSQVIDLSASAADIDSAAVTFRITGYLGGYSSQGDNVTITAIFQDAASSTIASSTIGPVTPTERANATGLQLRTASGSVPAGTRRVTIQVTMTRTEGSYNDGYADNLTMIITNSGCDGVCTARNQCYIAGVPDPTTGVCSNPVRKSDGATCNDGNACTQTDTCEAGACSSGSPVVCPAPDQCHAEGTCNPATGVCSNPTQADGTTCDDGSACTQTDTCQAGACTGGSPMVCTAPDQCHTATCTPETGACSAAVMNDGTSCDDGNLCTRADACQSGSCTGSAIGCPSPDQCHTPGTCSPATGICSNPAQADGTTCNDGNLCTQTDTCQAGACTGSNAAVCPSPDQCHTAGTCNPATGICSNPSQADGTTCDDGSACTQADACQAGACTGGSPVVCPVADPCHDEGTCNPVTGVCSNPVKADGTACSNGSCQSGTCVSVAEVGPQPSSGCGCGSTGSAPWLASLAGLGFLGLLRRRRGTG
jgi:MYXO-CTERM domain-containing protein